jgi:hypothetical protein
VDYLQESAVSIYRRRRRRRAFITLTVVCVLLVATVLYAASYMQGWIGGTPPKAVASASCSNATSNKVVKTTDVTINVYNATNRLGIAADVAKTLEKQGFKVDTIDNDPLGKSIQSPGEIRSGPSGAGGAMLAAWRLPGAAVLKDQRPDASVDLVLGNKYDHLSRKLPRLNSVKVKAGC